MDIGISGMGQIAAGEYENIRISGRGSLQGFIRCTNFHCSGSASGDNIECAQDFKVSGHASLGNNIMSGNLTVSGFMSCKGNLTIEEKATISGSASIGGSLKCRRLAASGKISVGADAQAEIVDISGSINCAGLLNGEEITIRHNQGMNIGSIGGSKIIICRDIKTNVKRRLPLISSLIKNNTESVRIENFIEGDFIALENVVAPTVSGRIVAIGENCVIDLVRYSEQIEISPDAKVLKTEKI